MCSTGFQIFFPLEVSWGVFGGKKLASKYLFICCCLSLSLSVQNSIWHSSSDILQDGEFYKRTISSVTRCWSKKQPIFLQKLPKKYPHKFNIKMQFFTIALNVAKYLGYFSKELFSQELSKIAQSGHTDLPKWRRHRACSKGTLVCTCIEDA